MNHKQVAILICGHIRNCKDSQENFYRNIVSIFDSYDVFMNIIPDGNYDKHTLFNPVVVRADYNTPENINYSNEYLSNQLDVAHSIEYYKRREKEKDIKEVSMQKALQDKSMFTDYLVRRFYCSALSYKTVNNLRKEYEQDRNIRYDWVMRCRPDLVFFDKLSFHDFIPNKLNTFFQEFPEGVFNIIDDRFAIGPPEIMDVYMRVVEFYDNLQLDESFFTNWKDIFANYSVEGIHTHYLYKNKIEANRLDSKIIRPFWWISTGRKVQWM